MDDSLCDFLNAHSADAATLQHAVRYLAAELTDDATSDELLGGVRDAVPDAAVVDRILIDMVTRPDVLEAIDLAVLQAAWDDGPATRQAAQRAVLGAKTKLPVVELMTICATALAMYSLYLRKTGGRKHTSRALTRAADGTLTETETTEWYGPAGPLASVTSRLTGTDPGE